MHGWKIVDGFFKGGGLVRWLIGVEERAQVHFGIIGCSLLFDLYGWVMGVGFGHHWWEWIMCDDCHERRLLFRQVPGLPWG